MRCVSLGLIAVVAGALVPCSTSAAAFTAPRALSPAKGNVDTPLTAVTPDGRTAVMWRTTGRRTRDFHFVAAIGASATALGRPVIVKAGSAAARTAGTAQLLALPTGQFAACFASDPRRGDAVAGCSFSQDDGSFGPMSLLRRIAWTTRPQVSFVAGAGGRVVALLGYAARAGQRQFSTGVLDSSGLVGPPQAIAALPASAPAQLATIGDGTVAIVYEVPTTGGAQGATSAVLRLLAPGATQFGAPTPVPTGSTPSQDAHVVLTGGQDLLVEYSVGLTGGTAGTGGYQEFVVRRLPDGTFTAPVALPTAGLGFFAAMTQLADGTPLVVATRGRRSGGDCAALVSGAVRATTLAAGGASVPVLLSNPTQIALDPQVASLADGSAIATWVDAVDDTGAQRVEVAVQPAGLTTFGAPQVLPTRSVRAVSLAAGGGQAVLAWITGSVPDGPAHVVVSALGGAAPYAPSAPRPVRPSAPCE